MCPCSYRENASTLEAAGLGAARAGMGKSISDTARRESAAETLWRKISPFLFSAIMQGHIDDRQGGEFGKSGSGRIRCYHATL